MTHMQELMNTIQLLAANEMDRANKVFPEFRSKHEAIGVLDEELFEMATDLKNVEECSDELHKAVYRDGFLKDKVQNLEAALTAALAEGIQCIAMCKKFRVYLEDRNE